jgi:hypothetical protein
MSLYVWPRDMCQSYRQHIRFPALHLNLFESAMRTESDGLCEDILARLRRAQYGPSCRASLVDASLA